MSIGVRQRISCCIFRRFVKTSEAAFLCYGRGSFLVLPKQFLEALLPSVEIFLYFRFLEYLCNVFIIISNGPMPKK